MQTQKLNNVRKFWGGGPRPDLTKIKQAEALERQAAYAALSVQQKIDLLDRRLGVGVGAKKQRAKLATLLGKKEVVEETNA
jgi:hypothetical protein